MQAVFVAFLLLVAVSLAEIHDHLNEEMPADGEDKNAICCLGSKACRVACWAAICKQGDFFGLWEC